MYQSLKIVAGNGGWGGPLVLVPTETRNKIVSVTGGGIHPLAAKIAEMTGCTPVDGFSTGVPDEEILLAVVDCGGTARCGVYPKKGILTANVLPVGKTGPLAQFITKELYVSAVDFSCLSLADASESMAAAIPVHTPKSKEQAKAEIAEMQAGKKKNFVTRLGIAIGGVVNKFYAAGRETINITIKSILPFMAFVSMILGIISISGLGNVIATTISPLTSTLPGMLVISLHLSLLCLVPARSLRRWWERSSAHRSAWAISLRSMHCPPSLRSMRRLVRTSFQSASVLARRILRRLSSAYLPFSIHA